MRACGSWTDAGMDDEERNGFLEFLEAVPRLVRLAKRNAARARLSLRLAVGLFLLSTAAYVIGFVRPYWIVRDHRLSDGDVNTSGLNAVDRTYSGVWEDCRLFRGQRSCAVFITDIDSVVAMLGCVGGALHVSVCLWTLLACLRSPRRKRRVITVVGAVFGGIFGLSCGILFIAVHGKQPYSWGLVLNLGGSVLALVASAFVLWTLRHSKTSASMAIKRVKRSANRKGVSRIVVKELTSADVTSCPGSPPRQGASRQTLLAAAGRVGNEAEFLVQAAALSSAASLPTSADRPRLPGTSSPDQCWNDSSCAPSWTGQSGCRHALTTSTSSPESLRKLSPHQDLSQTLSSFLTQGSGGALSVTKLGVTQARNKEPKRPQTISPPVSPPVSRDQMPEKCSAPVGLDTPSTPLSELQTVASSTPTLSPTPSEICRAFSRTREIPHSARRAPPRDKVRSLPSRPFYRQHVPHKKRTWMRGAQGTLLSDDNEVYHSVSYFSPEQKFVSFKPQTSAKRRKRDDSAL